MTKVLQKLRHLHLKERKTQLRIQLSYLNFAVHSFRHYTGKCQDQKERPLHFVFCINNNGYRTII